MIRAKPMFSLFL